MESLSLDIASVDEKDEQQMITLVDTSNLDGNDLVENSLPLVHHVLEPSDLSKDSSDKLYDSTHCLICNAQFGVSGRGAVHLFSDEVKTTSRLLELPIFLSSIIQRDLNSSNMHSTTICKKCYKFLDDIDSVESQLANMKQEITSKFFQTQVLIQHEKNLDELAKDECIYPESHISSDEKEYKITSRVRNKKKRGRGKKRTPAYVKLEVKEESDEPINFVDYVSADQNDALRALDEEGFGEIVKVIGNERTENSNSKSDFIDIFEVDGLDLNNEDSTLQIGGVVLPTVCNGFANKELFSNNSNSLPGFKINKYRCRFCQITISSFSEMQNHLLQFHGNRLFECEVCEERCESQTQLLEHLEQHLLSGEKPFSCNLCSRRYALPRQLKEHLRHHLSKTIPCYHCSKRFKTENFPSRAYEYAYGYECTLCGVGFMRKPQLMGHIQQHERTENIEAYIKVNSSSVVDAEISESRAMQSPTLALKIDEEQSIDNNLDHIQLVRNSVEVEAVDISRQIQLSDDVPHYVIHKAGDKSDESVDHFLASLRGQVVEVRAEDLERYTELTADQISHMAQVAAQVVVTQGNAGTGTQLSQDTPDFRLFQIQLDDDTKGPHRQTDTAILSTGSPLVVAQSKIATNTTTLSSKQNFTFKKNSSQTINNSTSNNTCEDSNCSTSIRQNRNWVRSSTDFVDNS
ncbi:Zinc finger and BTB domain-containing protein 48 [Armadillidium nasatum]|uniref:Zinc finger and BTB domain-containing protein 48 n=1 Tax=Armadillidium nasatum TaxID=96803 RepID=A0A5N5T5R3_9CRUS|nr:Zinc finger and BTB domain-containing protein 48 [Armadillidium nasatum]